MMHALTMTDNKPRHNLVVGLGKTGLSCARFLRHKRQQVTVVDSRDTPPNLEQLGKEFPDIEIYTGKFEPSLFESARRVVVSPGIPVADPAIVAARDAGAEIIGDIELFAREVSSPIIAITGSNGKSTVTTLVGMMCQASGMDTAVGGNLGQPALSLIADPEPSVYVLELSSFQLETVSSLNAHSAAVLNISPDHMDRYADSNVYAATKQHIFHGDGTMILNNDDPRVMAMEIEHRHRLYFGLGRPVSKDCYGIISSGKQQWLAKGEQRLMPVSEVRLIGQHNLANILAAMALAETMGVLLPVMKEVVTKFAGLPHRSEIVAERDGIVWVNDSKATNVGATSAALMGLDRPVILIAGGQSKSADFSELRDVVNKHVRALILLGEDASQLQAELGNDVPTYIVASMHEAVARANVITEVNDIVLLSPACASFDMFRNYEHRGESFRSEVQSVIAGDGGSDR